SGDGEARRRSADDVDARQPSLEQTTRRQHGEAEREGERAIVHHIAPYLEYVRERRGCDDPHDRPASEAQVAVTALLQYDDDDGARRGQSLEPIGRERAAKVVVAVEERDLVFQVKRIRKEIGIVFDTEEQPAQTHEQ